MPKYSVSEVLDIIKNLTVEEKLELQAKLPEVLSILVTNNEATTPSHNFSEITQEGNIGSSNLQEALNLLATLK